MRLSVVIPAYNLERYIAECLEGVLQQQVDFEYEVICIDDASSDGTWQVMCELARQYPSLAIYQNPQNLGLAGTQRRLFELATGDIIAYMDGDDVALPGKLQALVNYLEAHPEYSIAFHEAEKFDHETGASLGMYTRDFYNAKYLTPITDVSDLIRYGNYINASSVAFRAHEKLANVVNKNCQIILDYPLHIMNALYTKGSIGFIDQVLGRYRIHSASFIGRTKNSPERRIRCLEDQIAAVKEASVFGISQLIVDQGIAHHRFCAALNFLNMGHRELFESYIAPYEGCYFDDRHKRLFEQRDKSVDVLQEIVRS